MPPNPSTQQDYWWREVYYEDLTHNIRKAVNERPSRTALFWHRQEPAAWLYELIRRSTEVKSGQLKLPGYDGWPSFPTLKAPDQISLTLLVERSLGFRAAWTYPPPPGRPPRPGYSDALPPYSVDLFASDEQIKDLVSSWLTQQRSKYKCERPVSNTEKARRSRNRRELPKEFDWRVVESMDHVKGKGASLSDNLRSRKSEAKKYIVANRAPLIKAIQEAHGEAQIVFKAIAAASGLDAGSKLDLENPLAIIDMFDETDAFLKSLLGQTDPAFARGVMSQLAELQKKR